ncbi:hypothetical protein H6P1_00304 (plasmid) [Variovorax sp. PBL-H6]|uniref:hypothetical protein n=2 Tax=Variovorax TaxID=34072 RepID=UPI001317166A|nr:hypothetical protein [Variovorax sp. PBL-H6]VTU42888.1 hypothetical protein H6P1_00304 [Variovorax sp. PBL-H6]VTU43605.1 hypothetical protein SRS16P1_00600 [Variovorax sp. SRS16]VTU43667.1 hypothetical protein E5P1_00594 [Variovorax sp. PBL-E5]
MGRREWEKGEVVIPSAAWAGFKKDLREAYNKAIAADFELAKRVHERVKAAQKGKRNVDWEKAVWAEIHATDEKRSAGYGYFGGGGTYQAERYEFKVVSEWNVKTALLVNDEATGKVKLATPKAKSFAPVKSDARQFYAGNEASITLVDESRTAKWNVYENKNACEEARQSYMGRAFLGLLAKVKWTRGSGGSFHGNDEYHEDAGREHAGGGGSYIKDTFGPLGDDDYERTNGIRRAKAPAFAGSRTVGKFYR